MEEHVVSTLELSILVLTAVTAAVGCWSIYWARTDSSCWRGRGGRILFVANLLVLGGTGVIAALARAQGLPPLGLIAGLLVVGVMWEGPAPAPGHVPEMPPDGQLS
jgi:hypothetical protein